MKFLDISSLAILTTQLTRIDAGDSYIYGRIEAYSCTKQIKRIDGARSSADENHK